jgi:cytochrome c biogenesis factor
MDEAGEGMEIGAILTVDYLGAESAAVIRVSEKRLISLLWLGSLLALVGGCIAIIRRSGENRRILRAGEKRAQ